LLSVKLVFWIADCFFAESRSGIFFFLLNHDWSVNSCDNWWWLWLPLLTLQDKKIEKYQKNNSTKEASFAVKFVKHFFLKQNIATEFFFRIVLGFVTNLSFFFSILLQVKQTLLWLRTRQKSSPSTKTQILNKNAKVTVLTVFGFISWCNY
jgi:hypothetical protein